MGKKKICDIDDYLKNPEKEYFRRYKEGINKIHFKPTLKLSKERENNMFIQKPLYWINNFIQVNDFLNNINSEISSLWLYLLGLMSGVIGNIVISLLFFDLSTPSIFNKLCIYFSLAILITIFFIGLIKIKEKKKFKRFLFARAIKLDDQLQDMGIDVIKRK